MIVCCYTRVMPKTPTKNDALSRTDIHALEADAAFFDARLALAGKRQETVYQKAQKRIYELLGEAVAGDLQKLRNDKKK